MEFLLVNTLWLPLCLANATWNDSPRLLSQCTALESLNIWTYLQQTNLIIGSWQYTGQIDAKTRIKFSCFNSHTFNFRFTDAISRCCRSWMLIPDPGSQIRILSIPDLGSASKNLSISKNLIILTLKMVSKLSEIWSGLDPDFLPIPDPGSRIQGSKGHRIPDTDPQHSYLACLPGCGFPTGAGQSRGGLGGRSNGCSTHRKS